MKMKKLRISIFMLIISFIACGFMFVGNNFETVYAADNNISDCYYLITDNTPYKSDTPIGRATGAGKYVVGTENVVISAEANDNYQLVGWQITYKDSAVEPDFIDCNDLDASYKKTVTIPTNENDTYVDARFEFTKVDNYFKAGKMILSYVFENLEIAPVFDYVYYKIDVNDLVLVSGHNNSVTIGDNTLYYEEAVINDNVTNYTNSYLKDGGMYYYYGNLYKEEVDGKDFYYTIHQTKTATPTSEKVDYLRGAYRVGELVDLNFNVNIDNADIKNSVNLDLISVKVASNRDVTFSDSTPTNFVKVKDSFLRTQSYQVKFNVEQQRDYVNSLTLNYHSLYVVDLKIKVDGEDAKSNELIDIFGEINDNESNLLKSNITLKNFYSKTTNGHLQYLVKKSKDNGNNPFIVTSAQKIVKTFADENKTYEYYNFVSIDDENVVSKSYENISMNLEVLVDYDSVKYNVNFSFALCQMNSEWTYEIITGNVLETLALKRGETVEFNANSVAELENVGYRFLGFAKQTDEFNIETETSCTIDFERPKSATILLCYEKIEYTLKLTNYNKINIDETYPLNTVIFNIERNQGTLIDEISQTELSEDETKESIDVQYKVKLGDVVNILTNVNTGFDIYGYSLTYLATPTKEDCFTSFEVTQEFISANNLTENILLYVYEKFLTYEITYYIEPTFDSNDNADVVMADIGVAGVNGYAVIKKYDVNNVLISEENNNLAAVVAKIVVSELNYKDNVTLTSVPKTKMSSDGQTIMYTYMFNWFTEDDKATLSVDENSFYNHTETVLKDRAIKVVYSMPNTMVSIKIEERFSVNEEFEFDIQISQNGEILVPEDVGGKVYLVEVGSKVTVVVSNIAFGYEFIGYTPNSQETVSVNGTSFEYIPVAGVNDILLNFKCVEIRFEFTQYGGGMNGEPVEFGEGDDKNAYINLNIDNATTEILKPTGYYVSKVVIAENVDAYSPVLSETNDLRNNNNIFAYNFNLTRAQFKEIIENYSEEETDEGTTYKIVKIKLNYSIFTYTIDVNYSLTNSKGELDKNVKFPLINVAYNIEGTTITVDYDKDDSDSTKLVFHEIPYGVCATLNVLSGAPTGLSLTGWYHSNDNMIEENEYVNTLNALTINSVINDKSFKYKLTYNAYTLNLIYNGQQGSPIVKINDTKQTGTIQVTLYDKIEINAGALRENGYKFVSFKYKVPVYTEYVYNDETWNEKCFELYVIKDKNYVLNTSNEFSFDVTYYTYLEEDRELIKTPFIDESFHILNYVLGRVEGGNGVTEAINITIEYELLQLKIKQNIIEKSQKTSWKLTRAGTGKALVQIDENNFATFTFKKNDALMNADDSVSYYDTITVEIAIKTKAINAANETEEFDLTLGLVLDSIIINGTVANKTVGESAGTYVLKFYVGNYLSDDEIIEIDYTFNIQTKKVTVTTVVKDSTEFYSKDNTSLVVNAKDYGFDQSAVKSKDKAESIEHPLQFLARVKVYVEFKNSYAQNFEVSGVNVYFNNGTVPLTKEELDSHGIVFDNDKNNTVPFVLINRMYNNYKVEFKVQPKITFNGGPSFTKVFSCDNFGYGIEQLLTIGSTNEYDIQAPKLGDDKYSWFDVTYSYEEEGVKKYLTSVINSGEYNVEIKLNNIEGKYNWLEYVVIAENVSLTIIQKEIWLSYDSNALEQVTKEYDGSSEWNASSVNQYLKFLGDNGFELSYATIVDLVGSPLTILDSTKAFISTNGADGEIKVANENVYYGLYLYDIKLGGSQSENFNLKETNLFISNYIKILRKTVTLTGLQVYNKVYDGTEDAVLANVSEIKISGKVGNDNVEFNAENVSVKFDNADVGVNKRVRIDAQNILVGTDAANYKIDVVEVSGLTIYPYQVSVNVEGLGEVSLMNKRGLTEYEKVGLIPINATLRVVEIRPDTVEYANIYKHISQFLKGNNEYAMGYKLELVVNGEVVNINNDLYVSVPRVKNLTGAYFLTGSRAGEVGYVLEGNNVVVDLKQINENINYVFLTQKRILLKPWQIVLIVSTSVLVIAGGVLTFVIVRKRKLERYSINEKI